MYKEYICKIKKVINYISSTYLKDVTKYLNDKIDLNKNKNNYLAILNSYIKHKDLALDEPIKEL